MNKSAASVFEALGGHISYAANIAYILIAIDFLYHDVRMSFVSITYGSVPLNYTK
jgi:hypothetical protein